MRRRVNVLFLALLLFMAAGPALAWHEPGHKITALIAYQRLTPEVRRTIVAILKHHPRFAEDFKADMPEGLSEDEQARWLFAQASVWPDLVRRRGDGVIPPTPTCGRRTTASTGTSSTTRWCSCPRGRPTRKYTIWSRGRRRA